MTAKNRHKNSTSEKSTVPSQEDMPKKNQKTSSNGVSGSPAQGGSGSGSCLGFFVSALFYITLLGGVGFAAFYLQQVMEEIRQTNAKHEKSAKQNEELISKMQSMEGAISRMKKGEVETRKVEEALHKLQNDLLKDLSQGMAEVKKARESDFSSLERTVEERLAEVSQSVKASVAEFTEAQGEAQTQMSELKARMGDMEDPALVKQEFSVIVDTVAEIRTAKQEADTSMNSLRQQISTVREELQTRNQEVASLSQEVESVRTAVQENIGRLKQSLSEAEASVQLVKEDSVTLESRVEQTAEAVRSVESKLVEGTAKALKRSDELEVRVKASEESGETLSASLTDITTKVESLLTTCAQGQTVEQTKITFEQEIMEKLVSQDSSLSVQVEELVTRLEVVENSEFSPSQDWQLCGLSG
uniref:Cytoskeleton-associated protein 4 n=1 Tax=Neogobius melanostomus TaxID=47308 RepID=A0A8C6UC46_9GOBI